MNVYVDASFLIALFSNTDEFHARAYNIARKLKESKTDYFTSNIVFAEAINLIFRKEGAKATEKFIKSYKETEIKEVFIGKDIFGKGVELLLKQKSKRGLNLFDCFHLATMNYLGVDIILTFDERFKKEVQVLN